MSRLISSLLGVWRHPRLREIFLWSLPALVLALVLRVMLCIALPYAYYHDDGPDFFRTPDRLISEHKWQLHDKKTFLVPFLFTVPFAPACSLRAISQLAMSSMLNARARAFWQSRVVMLVLQCLWALARSSIAFMLASSSLRTPYCKIYLLLR